MKPLSRICHGGTAVSISGRLLALAARFHFNFKHLSRFIGGSQVLCSVHRTSLGSFGVVVQAYRCCFISVGAQTISCCGQNAQLACNASIYRSSNINCTRSTDTRGRGETRLTTSLPFSMPWPWHSLARRLAEAQSNQTSTEAPKSLSACQPDANHVHHTSCI